jgi:hypothetical protein
VEVISDLITSVTGLLGTVLALFLLHQGQVDRRAMRLADERDQAQKITSWADWLQVADDATLTGPRLPAIFVANSSDAAVHDVFVDFYDPKEGVYLRAPIGPVPPGATRARVVDFDGHAGDGWEPSQLFPQAYFRDSAGRRWLRDALGRLRVDPGSGNDDFFARGGTLLAPSGCLMRAPE